MDTLEKFQDMAVEEPFTGTHGYWLQVFDGKGFGTSHTLGSDIARMGLELATIPVMSTEAERIFSGSKLTISDQRSRLGDDIIEALECLKSWAREEVIFGAGTEVGQVGEMLEELEQRALDMEL